MATKYAAQHVIAHNLKRTFCTTCRAAWTFKFQGHHTLFLFFLFYRCVGGECLRRAFVFRCNRSSYYTILQLQNIVRLAYWFVNYWSLKHGTSSLIFAINTKYIRAEIYSVFCVFYVFSLGLRGIKQLEEWSIACQNSLANVDYCGNLIWYKLALYAGKQWDL